MQKDRGINRLNADREGTNSWRSGEVINVVTATSISISDKFPRQSPLLTTFQVLIARITGPSEAMCLEGIRMFL